MEEVSETSVQSVRPSTHGVVLAIAGCAIVVGPLPDGPFVVHMEPAAGLMKPAGILNWSKEVSVVERRALTPSVMASCQLVVPEERIDRVSFALAHEAARKAPLVAVDRACEGCLRGAGIVVYTVGFDRTSGCLFVLSSEGVSVQGDVYQALSSSVDEGSESLEACLDGLIDRILSHLTDGVLTELSVELAAALPEATVRDKGESDSADGANGGGMEAFAEGQTLVKLAQMEAFLAEHLAACTRMGGGCDEFVDTLVQAQKTASPRTSVALFGEAILQTQGSLALQLSGETSTESILHLAARKRWTVTGAIREPAARPKQISQPREPSAKPAEAREPSDTPAGSVKFPAKHKEAIADSAKLLIAPRPASQLEITARKVHQPAPQQVVLPRSSAMAVPSVDSTRNNEMTEQSPSSRSDDPSGLPPKPVDTVSTASSSDAAAVSGGVVDDSAVSQVSPDGAGTENGAEKPMRTDVAGGSEPEDVPSMESERRLFQVQTPPPQALQTDESFQPAIDIAAPDAALDTAISSLPDSAAESTADTAAETETDTEVKAASHGAAGELDTSEQQDLTASQSQVVAATSVEPQQPTDPNAVAPIPPVSENKKSMVFGVVVTIIVLALFVLWAMR